MYSLGVSTYWEIEAILDRIVIVKFDKGYIWILHYGYFVWLYKLHDQEQDIFEYPKTVQVLIIKKKESMNYFV